MGQLILPVSIPRHCLEQGGFALTPVQQSRASDADPATRKRLRCGVCGHCITDAEQRIVVAGAHLHRRHNPLGIEFEIGCFRVATGCREQGEANEQFTWFAGYQWKVTLCAQCGEHLGWLYTTSNDSFYGLILERLVAEQ